MSVRKIFVADGDEAQRSDVATIRDARKAGRIAKSFIRARHEFLSGWGCAPASFWLCVACETHADEISVVARLMAHPDIQGASLQKHDFLPIRNLARGDFMLVVDRASAPGWFGARSNQRRLA
jgi:hypothetical protein